MKTLRTFTCFAAFLACGAVQADGKYGMAGCGIGALIFEDKPGKIQLLAATTNDYFGQTFSITSGTSNCLDVSSHEQAKLFIDVNQKPLAKDISRGQGETLDGLARVLGCSDNQKLGVILQKNYKNIFARQQSNGSSESTVADAIEATVQDNAELKANCALYG